MSLNLRLFHFFRRLFRIRDLIKLWLYIRHYGTLLGNIQDGSVQHNEQSGHLLRTKLAGANEGGFSLGTDVGDSPYLF
uniref:Secreted protein n=1 Tax=Globodera pallida TaxID=36090 RepID=A0A183C8J5_GLOPA